MLMRHDASQNKYTLETIFIQSYANNSNANPMITPDFLHSQKENPKHAVDVKRLCDVIVGAVDSDKRWFDELIAFVPDFIDNVIHGLTLYDRMLGPVISAKRSFGNQALVPVADSSDSNFPGAWQAGRKSETCWMKRGRNPRISAGISTATC